MKKNIIGLILLVAIIVSLAPCAAHAASISGEIDADMSSNYIITKANGAMVLRYNVATLFLGVRASTDISVSADAVGAAQVRLKAANNTVVVERNTVPQNGVINSGKAIVSGQIQAESVEHYAYRVVEGIYNNWTYTCK